MFYRSGWLRCVGLKYVGIRFSVLCVGVYVCGLRFELVKGYCVINYTILHILYYTLLHIILLLYSSPLLPIFWSPIYSFLISPSFSSLPLFSLLQIYIPLSSSSSNQYLSVLTSTYLYLISSGGQFDPACFIGVDGWGVWCVSVSVLVWGFLFIFSPRMFYRSGWLRCVVSICVYRHLGRVIDVCWAGV